MRVLSIYPGYGRCVVAVIEKNNGREKYIYSDCIETGTKTPFDERLSFVASECERLIQKHRPDALAMERLFFTSNQKTAMHVAEVRGGTFPAAEHSFALILALARHIARGDRVVKGGSFAKTGLTGVELKGKPLLFITRIKMVKSTTLIPITPKSLINI